MRKDGYVVVQPWMVTDYNLNGNKLLIYALIWGFSQDEQSCFYGSVSYIVEYFKLSKRAVLNLLAELEKDGLIRKWTEPVNGRPTNRYAALRPAARASASDGCKKCTGEENAPVQNVHSDGCKKCTGEENAPVQNVHSDGCKKCTSTGAECAPKKENNNKSENKGPSATRFSPPTVEQVRAYFRERGVPPADAQTEADKFVDRYEANGWIVGKTKMKDWKAAARNWLRNRKEWGQPAAQPTTPYGGRTWEDL